MSRWGAIVELRRRAELPGTEPTAAALDAVLNKVGRDIDLAVDAIAQSPRPAWVAAILGSSLGCVPPAEPLEEFVPGGLG